MTNGEMIKAMFPTITERFKDTDEYTNKPKTVVISDETHILTTISADVWNAEYKESTTKDDLGVENDLVSSIVEKISEEVTETHEEFIFETIRPYCENVVQMKISKRDLEQAVLKYYGKNDLGVDCISRESIKQKLQEHHDFFVNAYGGFSNLPQNDKSRVDEIINCIAMVVNEPSVTPQEPFDNRPCISSGVCEHDKQKVLDKIRAEIMDCLKALDDVEKFNIYLPNEMSGRRLTYKQCLGFIDKYKSEIEPQESEET